MMTTLRSDRRTRRNAIFNLEYLDDRIVLSAAAAVAVAEAHVAAAISSGNTKAAEKAEVTLGRDEVRLAKVEAKDAANLAKYDAKHHITPTSPTPTPIPAVTSSSASASLAVVAAPAAVTSTATSSTTAAPTATAVSSSSSSTANAAVTVSTKAASTSSSSTSSTSSTLPANVSTQLQSLYSQYESTGSSGTFAPTGVNGVIISGADVGINFQTSDSAGFNTLLTQLQSDGLQVTTDSATYGIIDGMLPIAQLPTVAQLSPTASLTALTQPQMR